MGWWEWVREFTSGITERIETGLKEVLGMPAEIEPYIPVRPATPEQMAEAMEEAAYAERFIQEIELDQARRLSRGVPFYKRLRNVAQMRHWTVADPFTTLPPKDAQWSVRGVLVAPDGNVTFVDVAAPTGEKLPYDEFVRRAASALEDDFVNQYEGVSRSDMIRKWLVAIDTYVQRFKPLPGK